MLLSKEQRNILWQKWINIMELKFTGEDAVRKLIEDKKCIGPQDGDITPHEYENGVSSELHFLKVALEGVASPPMKPPPAQQKKYPRPPDKRLHLVDFVIGQTMAIGSGNKPTTWYILERFNWKHIYKAWNDAHQHDPVTPKSLKSRFNHAIADPDVQHEIIIIKRYKPGIKFEDLLKTSEVPMTVEWTGRVDKASSVTVKVPDVKSMRIKGEKAGGMP